MRHTVRRSSGRCRRVTAMILVVAAIATAACSTGRSDSTGSTGPSGSGLPATLPESVAEGSFTTVGSVGQVHISDAPSGARAAVYDSTGAQVETGQIDEAGTLILRQVEPGDGYRVAIADGGTVRSSKPVRVLAEATSTPPQSFYDGQSLKPGMNYITTRDGTTLSARVYLPGPVEAGPYPTVVEYSGYNPSAPPSSALKKRLGYSDEQCSTGSVPAVTCQTPAQPSSTLALGTDFAVVAVNVRGTGCSGGAYDFFERLQVLDGYDVIETVAAQPWVANRRVGMVGLSYPGISQLFVAAAQPPSLAAIAPLSVFDDVARGLVAPGGIYNEGFALEWARRVLDEAEPLGQGWEQGLIDDGDTTCLRNQRFRGQNVDAVAKAKATPYYDPAVGDPLNPSLFVDRIKVPVFLTGSFQDEQTGPAFAHLLDRFTNAPVRRFTLMNGAHADGYAPQTLVEWKLFLDIYVAGKVRPISEFIRAGAPVLLADTFGTTLPLPPQRFLNEPDIGRVKAAYEAEPSLRVIWESGGGADQPGAPTGRFETTYTGWPAPASPDTWYLQPDGSLGREAPTETNPTSSSGFQFNPAWARKRTFEGENSNDLFKALPKYDWAREPDGEAVVAVSGPLDADQAMLGSGSVDLFVQSSGDDADLEVTLSEVRADGQEVYVQSGWLRASRRKLSGDSTALRPQHTMFKDDVAPLEQGEWNPVRIEIMPFGHVFRKGSRIRLSVHSPGGNRARWSFIVPEATPFISIAHNATAASRVVLPLLDTQPTNIPAEPPVCPGLRAQPCRNFEEASNAPGRAQLGGGVNSSM